MIFNIPHSSICIPEKERLNIFLSDEDLKSEINQMTDRYTDELFSVHASPEDSVVKFPVSRLVVDPERFEDDSIETMSRVGMGVIYTKTSHGKPLRDIPTDEERRILLNRYYYPHHNTITNAIEIELSKNGYSIIIDCHSFPSRSLPFNVDQNPNRPDICIGTDDYHTPGKIIEEIVEVGNDLGYRCSINKPYSGTFVPLPFYKQNKNVISVMIEINRSLYMDENTGVKSLHFLERQKNIGLLIEQIRKFRP